MKNLNRHFAWLYDLRGGSYNLTDDIPFYTDYAIQQNGEILDLGCGTGRVALALADKGLHITGLDFSQQMLDIFREKLAKKPEIISKIVLKHGNIANFSLNREFDLIIAPYHVFQAVTDACDIESTLACVRKHLSNKGIFIINVFKPKTVMDESWCGEKKYDYEVFDEKTGIYLIRKRCNDRVDLENQVIFRYLIYEVKYYDGHNERIVHHLEQKYYYSPQLQTVIEKAGFEISNEYSWYDKRSTADGREIIFICKKNSINHFDERSFE